MRLMPIHLGIAAALLALPAAAGTAKDPQRLPVFNLPDLDGKNWSSGQFAGQALVVDFWATWCASCRDAIPKLAELSKQYHGKGLTVVGISVDQGPDEKVAKAARKLGITYIVLRDKENALAERFGFSGIPSLYVFDRRGRL